LWLQDFVKAFPNDTPLAVEAPAVRHAHLSLSGQAELAARLTRELLGHIAGGGAR
jgi:hypothetical protein